MFSRDNIAVRHYDSDEDSYQTSDDDVPVKPNRHLAGSKALKSQVQIPIGVKCEARISHVEDIYNVWIMLEKNSAALMDQLSDRDCAFDENYKHVAQKIETPKVGNYVIVNSGDMWDNQWQRARIIDIKGKKIEVFLLDWGSTEVVRKVFLYWLPDQTMPAQAIHVCPAESAQFSRLTEQQKAGLKKKLESMIDCEPTCLLQPIELLPSKRKDLHRTSYSAHLFTNFKGKEDNYNVVASFLANIPAESNENSSAPEIRTSENPKKRSNQKLVGKAKSSEENLATGPSVEQPTRKSARRSNIVTYNEDA